ncbi:MAG: prephenate dehydratase domain-containing protein [Sphingomicrobium sp.]
MTIAYAGAPGAFAHEAALAFAPGHVAIPFVDFPAVADAVASGAAELGIVPTDNRRAGAVPGIAELLANPALVTLSTHELAVRVHLLALPGVRIEEVRMIASHPVALAQCAEHLAELGVATEEASNTAVAAASLSARDKAVLASAAAAETYGLAIVKRDMHDDPDNATRFALIGRAPLAKTGV